VARYGEYEEVTTGGNDRWPYARWDFSHFAPFYRGLSEYARGACTFVREGLSSAEPVLVAVPGRHLDLALGAGRGGRRRAHGGGTDTLLTSARLT